MQCLVNLHETTFQIAQVRFGKMRFRRAFRTNPGNAEHKIEHSQAQRTNSNRFCNLKTELLGKVDKIGRIFQDKFLVAADQFRAIHVVAAVKDLDNVIGSDSDCAILHNALGFLTLDHSALIVACIGRRNSSGDNAFATSHLMLKKFGRAQSLQLGSRDKASRSGT